MMLLPALLYGEVAAALLMVLLWWWQRRINNASIVDFAWTLSVSGWAICFGLFAATGLWERKVIVGLVTLIWSCRLAWHLGWRLARNEEDRRYTNAKEKWGVKAQRNLFVFYQLQALAVVFFALPVMVAMQNSQPLGMSDALAIGIALVAIGGEAWSDAQLKNFVSDPRNRGQVCRAGWWRYSRHPNFFFEWLYWWAYVAFAWQSPESWLSLLGPAGMYGCLVYFTGIPPTEEQSLKSKGDAYRAYQRTTNAFFPGPPRD